MLTGSRPHSYADAIESAIHLVSRERVPEALAWIDSEMQRMLAMQKPDGHIEYWYGEGHFSRTAMLYALMTSGGVRPVRWNRAFAQVRWPTEIGCI